MYAVVMQPIPSSSTTTRCWRATRAIQPSMPRKSPSVTTTWSPFVKWHWERSTNRMWSLSMLVRRMKLSICLSGTASGGFVQHGAPITPEVASFILGKMGSALQINVVDKSGFNSEESDFVVSVINNFADEKKVPLTQAYSYIVTFKGMDFLRQYQDIEKTLSNYEIVNDVSRVCANNGGRL